MGRFTRVRCCGVTCTWAQLALAQADIWSVGYLAGVARSLRATGRHEAGGVVVEVCS